MTLNAIERRLSQADIAFIHDTHGNVHYWKLRSLPAITYLGITNATYPTSWRQLKHTWQYERGGKQYSFPGYEYHVLGGIDLDPAKNLCVITTSYYEKQTQYSVNHLIDRYTQSEGTLVVIADEKQFQPEGSVRPLYQEPVCVKIGDSERIFEAFADRYAECGWDLPLLDTRNLFLHDNANLYELVEGVSFERTTELFDVLPEAPYLPLYRVFSTIFARPDQFGVAPLESEDMIDALGGWLRRRIEWDKSTASDIAQELNRAVSLGGTAFDPSYAQRSPKLKDAAEAATELSPSENDIDHRYHDWLTNPL